MIHRSPIPAPIHGAQCIIECLVATDHRRRRGNEERGSHGGVGSLSEGGVVCRDVGVEVERCGVLFLFLKWARGCTFAGAGFGCRRRVGFIVPSG